MPATVRIGICSFADEGLLKRWYPRGVSTPAARLAYYGERFDTVEVDAPFYHLPDPAVTGRWAQRTPPGFLFHAKAHRTMTHHDEAEQGQAFAEYRASLEPLELSGKLRGILLQYHPSFKKSPEAKEELSRVRGLLDPLVPLVEFRHRSWFDGGERDDTLAFLERERLAVVSVDAPPTRASNVLPSFAAATHAVAYVRFHGRNVKTWNIKAEKSSERSTGCTPPRSSRNGSSESGGWRTSPKRSTPCSTTTVTTSHRAARPSSGTCSTPPGFRRWAAWSPPRGRRRSFDVFTVAATVKAPKARRSIHSAPG
jgi:uncharacterized protein YecE (DUF72 family)